MLQQKDPVLASLIEKEAHRQDTEIELIASENYVSKEVLEANGSILTNKYSEGYPGKRYYGGCEVVDEVENLAIERAKKLFGAEYVNVQPLSGSPANMAVYMGLLKPGDTVLGLSLDQGGHLSHGHPMNFSGILYDIIPFYLDKNTETIDMDEVERLALEHKPQMILAGFSAYSRNLDWKRFREIADKVGAILMADIAHIAGLVAAGIIENPVPYCDVVTTTTHKTLRGPRGGMIMSKAKHEKALARAVFPGLQGGPHENLIAGKAVAFGEALQPEFIEYQKQVVKNAQTLASELQAHGFKIISGGTDNHLVLVDVFGPFGVTGKDAEKALETVGLSTNKNMIPYDPRSPMNPSGIRIGSPAATTRGMKEIEMKKIAKIFAETIKNIENEEKLKELRNEVLELCREFPIYKINKVEKCKGISWLGIKTDKFQEMKNFYENILAIPLAHEEKGFCAFKTKNGDTFEIFDEQENEYPHFKTGPVGGFLVEDIFAMKKEMENAGIEFIGEIDGNADKSLWAHFRGPDGNVYELKWSKS